MGRKHPSNGIIQRDCRTSVSLEVAPRFHAVVCKLFAINIFGGALSVHRSCYDTSTTTLEVNNWKEKLNERLNQYTPKKLFGSFICSFSTTIAVVSSRLALRKKGIGVPSSYWANASFLSWCLQVYHRSCLLDDLTLRLILEELEFSQIFHTTRIDCNLVLSCIAMCEIKGSSRKCANNDGIILQWIPHRDCYESMV